MATSNTIASSVTVNSIIDDIAQALTDSINKDGTKAFAANQSMGGNRLTSLGAGTALTDAAQVSQVQKANVQRATTVGGSVDAITLAFTPAITSYTTGMVIRWASAGANTSTAPTVNIDTLGAKTIKQNPAAAALAVGQLGAAGTIHMAEYNGTDFILLGASPQALGTSDNPQFNSVNIGNASDTTITRISAGVIAVEGKNVALNGTTEVLTTGSINLGHASDTTLTRISAGAVQIEGFTISVNDLARFHQCSFIQIGSATSVIGDYFGFGNTARGLRVVGTGGLGYYSDGLGAGGAVTQLTSKSTTVTLNKHSGKITMHNAALAGGASVTFQFVNSALDDWSTMMINCYNNDRYNVDCLSTVGGGSAFIRVTNITGGSLSEALVLNFNIITGAAN
jgi:hypothetical protein